MGELIDKWAWSQMGPIGSLTSRGVQTRAKTSNLMAPPVPTMGNCLMTIHTGPTLIPTMTTTLVTATTNPVVSVTIIFEVLVSPA